MHGFSRSAIAGCMDAELSASHQPRFWNLQAGCSMMQTIFSSPSAGPARQCKQDETKQTVQPAACVARTHGRRDISQKATSYLPVSVSQQLMGQILVATHAC